MPMYSKNTSPVSQHDDAPYVSIVVASFNSASTIRQTFESILNQTYSHFEVLVMDGLSKDQTVEIAKGFNDSRVKIFSESDSGIYDAWNKGVKQAVGELILFIGSDDEFCDKNALAILVHAIKKESNALYWYGTTAKKGIDGLVMKVMGHNWMSMESWRSQYVFASIPSPIMSAIYRTDLVRKYMFDTQYRVAADYDMILKMLNSTEYSSPYFLADAPPLVGMGYGGVSTNYSTGLLCLRETAQIRRINKLSVVNASLLSRLLKIYILIFLERLLGPGGAARTLNVLHAFRANKLTGR